MTTIGFVKHPGQEPEWEGPFQGEFGLYRTHGRVMRYECKVGDRFFSFYAPLFMLRNIEPDDIPAGLIVTVGRAVESPRMVGFLPRPRPLRLESDLVEYAISTRTAPGNSKRYDFSHERQTYSLYVPNSVFEGQPHPERIWVHMGVPHE